MLDVDSQSDHIIPHGWIFSVNDQTVHQVFAIIVG